MSRLYLASLICLSLLLMSCGSAPTPVAGPPFTPITNITLEPPTAKSTPFSRQPSPSPSMPAQTDTAPVSMTIAVTSENITARPSSLRQYNPAAIQKILASLPANNAAQVILPDGQTIDTNSSKQVPAASTIKLWVAGAVLEQGKTAKLNLAEKYQIAASDIASGTGILADKIGQSLTLLELVNIMLIYSDNSATNILLDKLGGFARVNAYAQSNGYTTTRMQRRLGSLDPANENLTSPHDAATFMQRLLAHKIVDFNSSEVILLALEKRLSYPQDQNFFGLQLPRTVNYRHLSGTGPGVRNEVGFIQFNSTQGLATPALIIAIYTAESSNELATEATIATSIRQLYQAVQN